MHIDKNPDEQLSQLFSSTQAPVISRQEVPHGSTEQSLSVNQIIDGEASKDIKRIAARYGPMDTQSRLSLRDRRTDD